MKAEIKFNKDTIEKLKYVPDKIVYGIARQTLDRVGSTKITPYKTGRMERSMYQSGVKKDSYGVYYIGNFTDYATYVYDFPQSTNWTNPKSKAQWFDYLWKEKGKTITENVVTRYKL